MQISICAHLLEEYPDYSACFILLRGVVVTPANDETRKKLADSITLVMSKFPSLESIQEHSHTLAYREFAQVLGLRPKDAWLPEEQIKRVIVGRGINSINNIVDIYFAHELRYNLSMGAYDFEEICGTLTLCLANKSEEFIAIGGKIRSAKIGEVMFCDERGPIYSFSEGDARRTMVSENSKNVLIRIDGAPRIPLSSLVECATDLIAEVRMGTLYPLSRDQPSVNIMSPRDSLY